MHQLRAANQGDNWEKFWLLALPGTEQEGQLRSRKASFCSLAWKGYRRKTRNKKKRGLDSSITLERQEVKEIA